ncbi:hypothetical protein L6452_02173 [Arctium lappa]|uniref:Uncharacterized protein n=1 Tax=Arctium lappa TaxID=4217 RepID=A0ACB9FJ46_ARCLA|nr:hypothetical protein L6452_02173 [Arctium lappa]
MFSASIMAWCGTVPPFSPRSSLTRYLMDGKIMHGGGLIKKYIFIGNAGDLLKTKFGKEIDSYDVVLRENGAPIQNYTDHVGEKSTFRLLNRGYAKALDKFVELYGVLKLEKRY